MDDLSFSPLDSPWKVHLSNIDPSLTSITVSGLTPARTYQFRVCAVNQVGKGQYSLETSRYTQMTPLDECQVDWISLGINGLSNEEQPIDVL